ncbi:MAG: hypothetical protein VB084_06615 [Syntrophomonadaceae bacterium]|nr:hypothetical protein [Syntrophomonadaceae bacterium]
MLSILYLVVLWEEGNYTCRRIHNPLKQAAVAVIWQMPGFILALSVILGWDRLTDFAYYFIFILELWVTPILPLVSLLPAWTILERPLYYYLFFVIVPILAVYYCLPAIKKEVRK